MKSTFCRPDVLDLKHELKTLDTSTNTYIHTTSHTVPHNDKQSQPTLGMITQLHHDMRDSIELVEFQVRITTHQHIRSWKRRLWGTVRILVHGESIINAIDILTVVQRACNNKESNITIKFGSLIGFAMSGEEVPTLQTDQLNVTAHHLNEINTNVDLWTNQAEWSHLLESSEILPT